MLELLEHSEITQKQLVELTGYPKQSISKGVKKLLEQHFIQQTVDPHDKRVKRCSLTAAGHKFAEQKLQPLIEMEEATARQLGAEKMQQLIALSEEWDAIFWREIRKRMSIVAMSDLMGMTFAISPCVPYGIMSELFFRIQSFLPGQLKTISSTGSRQPVMKKWSRRQRKPRFMTLLWDCPLVTQPQFLMKTRSSRLVKSSCSQLPGRF